MDHKKPCFENMDSQYQVAGVSNISILDATPVSPLADDLIYYNGTVSLSPKHALDCKDTSCEHCKELEVRSTNYSLDCNVVAFGVRKESEVISLVSWLNSISSPYVMTPLACGRGLAKFKDYYFMALPKFTGTFTQYIKRGAIVDKRRFTEQFIQVIRSMVHGIMVLEGTGFSCRALRGNDVLITVFENTVAAKIWKFQKEKAKETSSGCIRLGRLIKAAATAQKLATAEVKDLCDKLISKGLKGLKVLKQSALLTPNEKFNNILALNLFILVNSGDNFTLARQENPEKLDAINDLLTFMQSQSDNWCKDIPAWIFTVRGHAKRTIPSGTEFVSWLRYILEHEHLFVPVQQLNQTDEEIQKFGTQPDLEAYIRALMEYMFLQAQNLAADLGLEY